MTSPPDPSRRTVLLLGLAFVVLWLGSLGMRSLVSADEGRYATLSLAMLESGDWVSPRLNGLLYFEKPPLQYWAGAVAMGLLGVNEFAARLWPGLCGLFTVALVTFTARRLWGPLAGWHAALVAGSSTWIVLNSHFLSLDAGLCFSLTLALCALLLAEHHRSRRWMVAAWAGVALAVLSKGLVGLVIPGATLVLSSLLRRDFSVWKRLEWGWGPVVLLAIAAPWFMLVSARNPDFAHFFFIHEHLDRYLSPGHRREGAWWYFVPYLLVGLLPWTGALPWALRRGKGAVAPQTSGTRTSHGSRAILLVWSGFIFLFFSASSSKLPSYILPMFPALALLLAQPLSQAPAASLRWGVLAPAAALWLALLGALPFAERAVTPTAPAAAVHGLAWGIGVGGALFLVAAVIAWRWLTRGRRLPALTLVAFAHLAASLSVLNAHDTFGQMRSADRLLRELSPALPTGAPVYSVRFYDQTLPFYLRRTVTLVDHRDEFTFGQDREPERWLPTLEAFAQRWQHEPRAIAFMHPNTLTELQGQGMAGRVVFQDALRAVVVKP